MAASTAARAKRYLVDGITAAVAGLGVDSPVLTVQNDSLGQGADDLIVVGKITRQLIRRAIVGGGGDGALHEAYSIDVYVGSIRGGDNTAAADAQCLLLIDAVIGVVRADPSLGGLVASAWPGDHEIVPDSVQEDDGDGGTYVAGYVTDTTIPIECYAKI